MAPSAKGAQIVRAYIKEIVAEHVRTLFQGPDAETVLSWWIANEGRRLSRLRLAVEGEPRPAEVVVLDQVLHRRSFAPDGDARHVGRLCSFVR
jgi:hypothetical protein